jgi:hypothetical protein
MQSGIIATRLLFRSRSSRMVEKYFGNKNFCDLQTFFWYFDHFSHSKTPIIPNKTSQTLQNVGNHLQRSIGQESKKFIEFRFRFSTETH